MDGRHDGARVIGADGEQGEVGRAEPLPDLRPVAAGAGIAGEEQAAPGDFQHEARPEAVVAIPQRARREVPGGRGDDADVLGEVRALPPVEFPHALETSLGQMNGVAERRHHLRVIPPADRAEARQIHVVVVVVGDEQQVDARQLREGPAGWAGAFRTGP